MPDPMPDPDPTPSPSEWPTLLPGQHPAVVITVSEDGTQAHAYTKPTPHPTIVLVSLTEAAETLKADAREELRAELHRQRAESLFRAMLASE